MFQFSFTESILNNGWKLNLVLWRGGSKQTVIVRKNKQRIKEKFRFLHKTSFRKSRFYFYCKSKKIKRRSITFSQNVYSSNFHAP